MRRHIIPGNVPGNHTNNYYANRERSRVREDIGGSAVVLEAGTALSFDEATTLQRAGAAAAALALAIGLNVMVAPVDQPVPHQQEAVSVTT